MIDEELRKRLDDQDVILNQIHTSLRRINAYFKWTFILTIVFVVLPVVGLLFAIPAFLKTFSSMYTGF